MLDLILKGILIALITAFLVWLAKKYFIGGKCTVIFEKEKGCSRSLGISEYVSPYDPIVNDPNNIDILYLTDNVICKCFHTIVLPLLPVVHLISVSIL
ncbi:hypothetical protein SAMN05661044_01374 [Olivibacter domesticus]|uniref:Uncharacterized protein n=1 Tax=Olivibacter domesticus TaxID=407022 RepID=A0A1H7KJF7_OLID1|nr:hypothetical protein SAMN05661044_01374 [Olivibacter domesticus]